VRRWIAARGGLTPRMIFLRGKQLQALFRPCYFAAQASTNRPFSSWPESSRPSTLGRAR
jgi:hypothetical protein